MWMRRTLKTFRTLGYFGILWEYWRGTSRTLGTLRTADRDIADIGGGCEGRQGRCRIGTLLLERQGRQGCLGGEGPRIRGYGLQRASV